MTKQFGKWVSNQSMDTSQLKTALEEVRQGICEANLGGHLYKKRIPFKGHGKRGSGRTIVCFKKEQIAIFIHGFAKNETDNLSPKELKAFKALAKILTELTPGQISTALKNGDFKEVNQ
ncbi:MAG: type II toxin-antitoxin system RelE/ParE family toxin [Verrucomicrobia bacterium]|nr:type II toxin-antitoxin system RelE/ParE family toxin [Verrucomicrobiota bacterium]